MALHTNLPRLDPAQPGPLLAFIQFLAAMITGNRKIYPVAVLFTTNLAGTYANGSSGVGATLTKASAGAFPTTHGVVPFLGMRVKLTAQTTGFQQGYYELTTVGSTSVAWVLTRVSGFDSAASILSGTLFGVSVIVAKAGASGTQAGDTSHQGEVWAYTGADAPAVGVDTLSFAQTTVLQTITGVTANFAQDALRVLNAAATFYTKFRSLATANRTATLPDGDLTIAGINLAQLWTAAQTYGYQLLKVNNAGATFATRLGSLVTANRDVNLPDEAGTLATQTYAAVAREQVLPMGVLGAWAIDGDGARTNGAGLVGATPTLTEAAAAQAKVENGGVFGNLAAVNAGYGATYQLFPDVPVAETDYVYFGSTVKFCEFALDMSATPCTYDAAGVIEWQYWDGAAWTALSIAYDGTHGATHDGSLSFARDGAISFIPPANWAQRAVDGVTVYWIRAGIAAGKAANMTQVGITNSKQHEIVTPAGGFSVRQGGTITSLRLCDAASTLHTTADVKFILVNYTTGEHSGELTFAQDVRNQRYTGLTLAVADSDVLGVLVTQEDGTNEPDDVLVEIGITVSG